MTACHSPVHHNVSRILYSDMILPLEDMTCWINECSIDDVSCICDSREYKYIVYIDSTQCSTCNIEQLYHWKEFIDKFETVAFYFIIAPQSKAAVSSLPRHFYKTSLNYPIFIDENYSFMRNNPHIPSDPTYHNLLLDKDNKVLMVGSPIYNDKIEKLLYEIVNVAL